MPATFPNLFSKARIGKLEIKNRVVMLPLSTNFPNENGGVTNEMIGYYAERAKGGAGLIIVEGAAVDFPVGKNGATKLRCDEVNFVPGLSRLADAIHLYGAKALIQMQHAGSSTSPEKTYGHQPVAPSDIKDPTGKITARGVTIEEIEKIIAGFVKTAKYAQQAGFDGVEIHAAHSYLLAQFLTPVFNQRSDEYGGTLAKRVHIVLDIIRGIRQETGLQFIIAVRMNGDEFTPGGLNVEDAQKIAVMLEEAGADLLDISTGLKQHSENLSIYYPQGWRVYLAEAVKRVVHIPVIAGGGIREPGYAEEVLSKGRADFIGLARGLLADPFWPAKAAGGECGMIRRCISCNIGCTDRRIFGVTSVKCSVNPDVGRENSVCICPGKRTKKKKVVVIGAGAAGLNAALEAKKRGHEVVVLEKGRKPGGVINIASVPYGKEVMQSYVDYLLRCLQEHKIEIKFNEEADYETVKSFNPDAIVVATGSRPVIPETIPGIKNKNVLTAHEVLDGKANIKKKNVVVLGGGSIGSETADFLAGDNNVTVVEIMNQLAADTERLNRAGLLKRLDELGVRIMTETRLEEVRNGSVLVKGKNGMQEIPADFVVIAVGVVPLVPEGIERIINGKTEYYIIGDAQNPGKLINAVSQGTAVGRML